MEIPIELRSALTRLIEDVVAGKWSALEADGRIGRLTAVEGAVALLDYGRALVRPPEETFELAEVCVWRFPASNSISRRTSSVNCCPSSGHPTAIASDTTVYAELSIKP